MQSIQQVTVYCASSSQISEEYLNAAHRLGKALAEAGVRVIYGGGAVGSMGRLADGALAHGGQVRGIIPEFMDELEWGHPGVDELDVVSSMHERKEKMLQQADAVVALPGGTGTLEELLEALTWKRLGLYLNPIVLVNTRGFYDSLIEMLSHTINEQFMDPRHAEMWSIVDSPEQVLDAIRSAKPWDRGARKFAAPKGD